MPKRKLIVVIVAMVFILVVATGTLLIISRDNGEYTVATSLASSTVSSTVSAMVTTPSQVATPSTPDCSQTPVFPAPVDAQLASRILYPGQIRGTDYKPHGAFRFDNRNDNNIEVRAIMDGYILKASRYQDVGGDLQHSLFYINDCGMMVLHGHLLQIAPALQEVFDRIPLNGPGDSRTTTIEPRVYLKKGDLIATKVGFENSPDSPGNRNVFVDFGLYNITKTNGVDYSDDFKAKHPNVKEYGVHALCWIDYLTAEDAKFIRSLPVGGVEGKASDYCR